MGSVRFLLQNEQKSQRYQKLLVGVLLEQEEQDHQQQQVSRIHAVQMKLVQQVPEKAGKAVDGPATLRGRRRRFPVRRLLPL